MRKSETCKKGIISILEKRFHALLLLTHCSDLSKHSLVKQVLSDLIEYSLLMGIKIGLGEAILFVKDTCLEIPIK